MDRGIDLRDPRVRMRRSHQAGMEHPRHLQVVHEWRGTTHEIDEIDGGDLPANELVLGRAFWLRWKYRPAMLKRRPCMSSQYVTESRLRSN